MLAMPKHHTAWIHLSPLGLFVVLCYIRMSFKGDPHSRLEERAGVKGRKKQKNLYEAYINSTDLFLEL